MTRLAGQVALVTHAGSGTGAAIARRLAAEGARVVISHADDDADGAARLVADITWRGGCAMAVQGDVAHWPDVRRLFAQTASRFGRLDILINDARTTTAITDAQPRDDAINLFGAVLMSQEALRLFGRDGGAIINLTSRPCGLLAPDQSQDAALDALTRGLTRTYDSRNIRVHAIAPEESGLRDWAECAADLACTRHAEPVTTN
ncbi:MAG: SDR family NAD(P)-dependent oxidoreductase [Hyphomicrobiales bacterium]|nr:SDR family NAD(P)-dependent oxidoreductase [Hyphomicrobiales bacterium]